MQKGELGTGSERRLIFIWEEVIATLPERGGFREGVKCRMKRWDGAVAYWTTNDTALKWAWSFHLRSTYRLDLCVTTRPAGFAQAVARLVEENNWPFRFVFARTAQSLGRALPTMPDVDRVIYGLPEQRWAFGPHGMAFPSYGQLI